MKLSNAEWQIMNALWAHHPATARQLAGQLPQETKWAYTTIKTMLTRLVEKGAVGEHKQGNTSVYEPLLERKNARGSAIRTLIDQAFEGGLAPMLSFLMEDNRLSKSERKVLKEMLDKNETNKE
ncbi:MAG: BlaI/MecI/CopY family transcriptional regulator [Phycisphaerae bacterium]|nr:BlaI/MecI/CopY family transcriptional regulator [Phycisphaerae bacterium]